MTGGPNSKIQPPGDHLAWRGHGTEYTLDYNQPPTNEEKSNGGFDNVMVYKTSHPIPSRYNSSFYHFEVTIVKSGDLSIGVGSNVFALGMPGWDENSVGYRSKTGNYLFGSTKGTAYGPSYKAGDIIGCTIRLFAQPSITFSINGRVLGTKQLPRWQNGVFPCIGVSTRGTIIATNMGQSAFDYPPTQQQQQILIGTICECLGKALDNEQYFPDVYFTFPNTNKIILAHKAILVARSLQFEIMFENSPSSAQTPSNSDCLEQVHVNCDIRLFRRLLKFIYKGYLKLRNKEEAKELMEIAALYSMDTLLSACQKAISWNYERAPIELMKVMLYAFRTNARDGTCLAKRYKKLLKNNGITVDTLNKVNLSALKSWGITVTSHRTQINSSINHSLHETRVQRSNRAYVVEESANKMAIDILKMAGNPLFADLWFIVASNPPQQSPPSPLTPNPTIKTTSATASSSSEKGKEPENQLAVSPLSARSKKPLMPAHRVILSAMSMYFRRVLQERFLPKSKETTTTTTTTSTTTTTASSSKKENDPNSATKSDTVLLATTTPPLSSRIDVTPPGWFCPHSPRPTDCRICSVKQHEVDTRGISPPPAFSPPPQEAKEESSSTTIPTTTTTNQAPNPTIEDHKGSLHQRVKSSGYNGGTEDSWSDDEQQHKAQQHIRQQSETANRLMSSFTTSTTSSSTIATTTPTANNANAMLLRQESDNVLLRPIPTSSPKFAEALREQNTLSEPIQPHEAKASTTEHQHQQKEPEKENVQVPSEPVIPASPPMVIVVSPATLHPATDSQPDTPVGSAPSEGATFQRKSAPDTSSSEDSGSPLNQVKISEQIAMLAAVAAMESAAFEKPRKSLPPEVTIAMSSPAQTPSEINPLSEFPTTPQSNTNENTNANTKNNPSEEVLDVLHLNPVKEQTPTPQNSTSTSTTNPLEPAHEYHPLILPQPSSPQRNNNNNNSNNNDNTSKAPSTTTNMTTNSTDTYNISALHIQEEHIHGLMEIGFDRNQALFALLTNGRDVEAAANWLLTQTSPNFFSQQALDKLITNALKPKIPRFKIKLSDARSNSSNVDEKHSKQQQQQQSSLLRQSPQPAEPSLPPSLQAQSTQNQPPQTPAPTIVNCACCGALVHRHEVLRSVSCGHRCCRGCWMRRISKAIEKVKKSLALLSGTPSTTPTLPNFSLYQTSKATIISVSPSLSPAPPPALPSGSHSISSASPVPTSTTPPPLQTENRNSALSVSMSTLPPALSSLNLKCLSPTCDKLIAISSVLKALRIKLENIDEDSALDKLWSDEKIAKSRKRREKLPVSIVLSEALADSESISCYIRWLYGNCDFGIAMGTAEKQQKSTKKVATIAAIFGEPLLLDKCLDALYESRINETTVGLLFSFSEQAGDSKRSQDLQKECIYFIQNNISRISEKAELHRSWPVKLVEAILERFKNLIKAANSVTICDIHIAAIMKFAHDRLPTDENSSARLLYDFCQSKVYDFIKKDTTKVSRIALHNIIFELLVVSEQCELPTLQETVIRFILESNDDLAAFLCLKWEKLSAQLSIALKGKIIHFLKERFKIANKTSDDMCHDCHSDFSVFLHRKHCSLCKKSFCKKCLTFENGLPTELSQLAISLPVKTCSPCHNILHI